MATLIPSITTCKFDTSGERRFARLLEAKLEDDYLCWYNVPIGPARLHPDFIILHPQRGVLILEVKDWRLSTIQTINRHEATIFVNGIFWGHNAFIASRQGINCIVSPEFSPSYDSPDFESILAITYRI